MKKAEHDLNLEFQKDNYDLQQKEEAHTKAMKDFRDKEREVRGWWNRSREILNGIKDMFKRPIYKVWDEYRDADNRKDKAEAELVKAQESGDEYDINRKRVAYDDAARNYYIKSRRKDRGWWGLAQDFLHRAFNPYEREFQDIQTEREELERQRKKIIENTNHGFFQRSTLNPQSQSVMEKVESMYKKKFFEETMDPAVLSILANIVKGVDLRSGDPYNPGGYQLVRGFPREDLAESESHWLRNIPFLQESLEKAYADSYDELSGQKNKADNLYKSSFKFFGKPEQNRRAALRKIDERIEMNKNKKSALFRQFGAEAGEFGNPTEEVYPRRSWYARGYEE
jgi:hypothetical protein